MNHTPGPWTVNGDGTCATIRAESVGIGYYSIIATVTQRDPHPEHGGGVDEKTMQANAELIASAPALLEANQEYESVIKNLINSYTQYVPEADKHSNAVKKARATLAKYGGAK